MKKALITTMTALFMTGCTSGNEINAAETSSTSQIEKTLVVYYTLDGRKAHAGAKGIVIQNGKK